MLTPKDVATIQADMAGLAGDAERPIVYKVHTGTTPGDKALGIPAQQHYDDLPITATVRELTTEEVQLSGGAFTIGDLEFGVRRAEVSNRDQVVYGSVTWEIKEIRQAYLAGVVVKHMLRCNKV